jgi:O-antigen/teichoic acid export membrane protein
MTETGSEVPERSTPPGRVSNRQIARNFTQQVVFRALGMVASVLTVSATTRHLGPTVYGALTTAVMFVGLWTSLTELGIGAVVVRRVMSGRGDLERLVRLSSGMSVFYCLPLFAAAAVSGALVYRDNPEIVEMLVIVSVGLILTTITTCFEPVFLVTVRFGAVALSDLSSRLASLGATILLVHLHADIVWFAVVQLVPPVVLLLVQGFAAAGIINWTPIFSLSESWHLLRESLPITGVLIVGVLYWRADGVILSLRSTTDQVGIYGLAYTLTFTVVAVASFFLSTTLSAMVHSFARDKVEFARFTSKSMEAMLFVGAPIAVVGAILAKPIVQLIGSHEFVEQGGPTVALLSFAVAATFATGVLSQGLFAAHDHAFLLRLSIVNLLFNIVLNVVLVPRYGAIGAGVALVFSEAAGMLVASWRLSRIAPYRTPWLFALRLTLPLAAAGATAALMVNYPVLLTLPIAAAVYLAVNVAIGPATPTVIKALLSKNTDDQVDDSLPEIDPEHDMRQAKRT